MKSIASVALLLVMATAMGCEEHVVRRSGYGATTPFGASNVPQSNVSAQHAQAKTAKKQQSQQGSLSTDWRGTPKLSGSSSIGQPVVPGSSAK